MKEHWRSRILRRELLRHARTLERLAAELERAEDYPTETAASFCALIRTTVSLMADRLNVAPVSKLQHIHAVLIQLGQHLRYAERSRIEHTPWSMVQATEAFLKAQAGPGCCFIIRPQWSYNYGITGDYVATYRQMVSSLSEWITLDEWHEAIGEAGKLKIYCVSFPRVERMNVLMHVNWGHEIGHILANEWLGENFNELWKKAEPAIVSRIEVDAEKKTGTLNDRALIAKELTARLTSDTMRLTQVGLKELISDFVGVHLFGPASLASLNELSTRFELDSNPIDHGNYPPWRYRLRQICKEIRADLTVRAVARPLRPYLNALRQIQKLTTPTTDLKQIASDIRTREAYHLIEQNWKSVARSILKTLPNTSDQVYTFRKRITTVNQLVLRIKEGIPPNEVGTWPRGRPAALADIWNAAWAYTCAKIEEDPNWGTHEDYQDIFQLVLKAIEASFVHSTYQPKLGLTGR